MLQGIPPVLAPAMAGIEELKAEVAALKDENHLIRAQLDEVRSMLGLSGTTIPNPPITPVTPTPPTPQTPTPQTPTPQTPTTTEESQMQFCRMLVTEGDAVIFPHSKMSLSELDAIYCLEITGDVATFVLLSGEEAFEHLTEDLSTFVDGVAVADNEYDIDSVDIITRVPGKAERTPDGWKVTEKAKITYKKDN